MNKNKELSFEESLKKLENSSEALKKEGITLEDALTNFKIGMEHYEHCQKILNDAKQLVQMYDRKKEELQDFSS